MTGCCLLDKAGLTAVPRTRTTSLAPVPSASDPPCASVASAASVMVTLWNGSYKLDGNTDKVHRTRHPN